MSQRTAKAADSVATRNGFNGKDSQSNSRPVHEVRLGRITGAIWSHTGDDGKVWFNVTFSRIYKDGQNNWARSDSFGKNDLPLLIKVADRCHDWIYDQGKEDSSN